MTLATAERGSNGVGGTLVKRPPGGDVQALTIDDVWYMAERAAASKMFGGIDTPDKAFTLMLICQAEGLHPIQALRRYDIIQGRPAMKAAAIQAEFQARGGLIELIESTPQVARALFSHPTKQPTPVELTARMEDYRHLVGKDNWKHYPADMLWARLVARGVRRIDPGVVTGIGSVEEAWDEIDREEQARRPQIVRDDHAGPVPPPRGDVPVPGGPIGGIDTRSFVEVFKEAAVVIGKPDNEVLSHLRNKAVQGGFITGEPPTKPSKIIETLTKVYGIHRDWLRGELAALMPEQQAPAEIELPPQPTATYVEADDVEASQVEPEPLPPPTVEQLCQATADRTGRAFADVLNGLASVAVGTKKIKAPKNRHETLARLAELHAAEPEWVAGELSRVQPAQRADRGEADDSDDDRPSDPAEAERFAD